jgi:hypothetical protein
MGDLDETFCAVDASFADILEHFLEINISTMAVGTILLYRVFPAEIQWALMN